MLSLGLVSSQGSAAVSYPLPNTISNLITWLDANDPAGNSSQPANNSSLAIWTDKSGSGYSPTQATGANQPLFILSALAGKPIIRFNGSQYIVNSSYFNIRLFTIFIVGKFNVNSNLGFFEINNGGVNSGTAIFLENGGCIARYVGSTANITGIVNVLPNPTASYNIFNSSYNGTNLSFAINNSAPQSTTSAVNANTLSNLNIGCLGSGVYPLNGDIAEMIVYNRSLNSAELLTVNQYLANKWGITIA